MKLSELLLNRFLYRDSTQNLETKDSVYESYNANSADVPAVPSGSAAIDVNTNSITLNGSQLTPGSVASASINLANVGWTQTCIFSVTDLDTVAWGSGTFTSAAGVSYSISAGNTGNMSARTFIYLDISVSTTTYQTTTNITIPVGDGKVLIAVAQNAATSATFALTQTNQISGDSILANTISAGKMNVGQLSAISADLGTVSAGYINGLTITGGLFRTATSGQRIELSSGNTNQIRFYDLNTLFGQLEVYKVGSDGYIGLISQDNVSGFEVYTGVGASAFSSVSIFSNGGSLDIDGNASNGYITFKAKNGGEFVIHGGPGGDEILTDIPFTTDSSITLGGVTRSSWPTGTPQTPWAQNIDAAGYNLTGLGKFKLPVGTNLY